MILRDTLSMAIAIHDVNPEPYKYCAWLIFDQLIPVREFQYQSPRSLAGFSMVIMLFKARRIASFFHWSKIPSVLFR